MAIKRIIPCLDIRDGKVVKGRNFEGIVEVADPAVQARKYNDDGADELVFYDITASVEGRAVFADVLAKVVEVITVPLMVGGGIATVEDCGRVLSMGASKLSINSGALKDSALIKNAAAKYGSECIALAMDVKRVDGKFMVFSSGGRVNTGIDAVEWSKQGEKDGAGELVINSIDTDGVKGGFDLELLSAISNEVDIPVVASGGAGSIGDFIELFNKIPKMEAGLAASIFHFGEVSIKELKQTLRENGFDVNL